MTASPEENAAAGLVLRLHSTRLRRQHELLSRNIMARARIDFQAAVCKFSRKCASNLIDSALLRNPAGAAGGCISSNCTTAEYHGG
jgi:hypothetical protein